ECILIGRVKVEVVVAIGHDAAARADVHRGLVPFGRRLLPGFAPLRRAARYGPIADRQRRVVGGTDVVAAGKVLRPAVRVPLVSEVVDRDVRAARAHERIEVAALEEERRAGAGLVAVVLPDDTLLRGGIIGLANP